MKEEIHHIVSQDSFRSSIRFGISTQEIIFDPPLFCGNYDKLPKVSVFILKLLRPFQTFTYYSAYFPNGDNALDITVSNLICYFQDTVTEVIPNKEIVSFSP